MHCAKASPTWDEKPKPLPDHTAGFKHVFTGSSTTGIYHKTENTIHIPSEKIPQLDKSVCS
ncbi:hypothetical protein IAD21_00025 [Abditibacteriota bacterium]|nr:hypothetical protein IAD21_00025 [Abditibacteriota bacterium]